jgi:hypothetical protein
MQKHNYTPVEIGKMIYRKGFRMMMGKNKSPFQPTKD